MFQFNHKTKLGYYIKYLHLNKKKKKINEIDLNILKIGVRWTFQFQIFMLRKYVKLEVCTSSEYY